MADRASDTRKLQKKRLPKVETEVYSKIALNKLVVFAVYYLQEREIAATVEDIISVCFRLFPHGFSLKHYPRWPDSALVIRRLNDGREKGIIKGSLVDGFSLSYRGKQLAERVARELGLAKPISAKAKKKIMPAENRSLPDKPAQGEVKESKVATQNKKPSAPVSEKKSPKKQLTRLVRNIVSKLIKPLEEAAQVEPVKARPESLPLVKAEGKPGKRPVKVTSSVVRRNAQVREKSRKQTAVKTRQPAQLTMKPPAAKDKKVRASRRPARTVSAEKVIAPAALSRATKEEKAKAGKIVRLMESSDAYRQYKKNGSRSKISEFDFRNMLFTTMESSPETLVRNVELFKRYAGLQNRPDLITFLAFCEGSFAPLLKPQAKLSVKKSKR